MKTKSKSIVVIRGLPGSGKTTLARNLKFEETYGDSIICEADDFFLDKYNSDQYLFDKRLIHYAHQYCISKVIRGLFVGNFDTALVSNTSTTIKEIRPYMEIALEYELDFYITEPENPDKDNVQKCFERNIHNVPLETIERMKKRWEHMLVGRYNKTMLERYVYGN